MTTLRIGLVVAVGAVMTIAAPVRAQGNLSTQGLGFPPGQLSTKAQAMGGATGESDALSPLNPASLSLLITSMIAMQAEPEYREVRLGAVKQKTSVARFPLFLGAMPVGPKWIIGVSASTLFDRTWSTTSRDTQVVGADTVASTVAQASEGAIVDLRLAAAYTIRPWLRVGIGGHAFSGQTSLRDARTFDDSLRFASDTQRTSIGYGGSALSMGVQMVWPKWGTLGMSYRRGGKLSTYVGPTITQTASAPDHFGISAIYLGIEGTAFAFRAAKDAWSNTAGLSSTLKVHEGWDTGLGVDVQGPRFGASPVSLRAGARFRTLPFSVGPDAVTERTLSGGVGLPLARGRSELSVGVLRSARKGYGGATENAWTLSTGFSVRP